MFNRYYQDELRYLHELGREFALAYPALAPMLAERGGDPDVERLLEGVAFLTARIREKLDDEVPEFINGVANVVFPDLVRPVPAATILELTPRASALRERMTVPAGTEFASVEVDGTPCRFSSSRDCVLVPWSLEDARLEAAGGGGHCLRFSLRSSQGAPVGRVAPPSLRLHFGGEGRSASALLAWALEHVEAIVLRDPRPAGGKGAREVVLPRSALRAPGFEDDDALVPVPRTWLPGLRLLHEYYALPAKFAFVDVVGMARAAELDPPLAELSVELRFDAAPPPEVRVGRESLLLHCVPAVNVFATSSEPLRPEPGRSEYLVRPAGLSPAHGEVYAVRGVEALERGTGRRLTLPSFYNFSSARGGKDEPHYVTHLRPSPLGGVDTTISFGAPRGSNAFADADVVSVDLWATNGALAGALRPGDVRVPTPSSPPYVTFRNLLPPSPHVAASSGRDLHWRAVAHASCGLRGLADPASLRALLDVHNRHATVDQQASRANELRIGALRDVRFRPDERLYRGSLVRGVAIDVELDERGFAGFGDLHLFGAVLDRLFASYVPVNAFCRLTAISSPSNYRFAWPARNGSLTLI
ncbi:MAG: type VI secretion system baseplate subunit TssF [Polyangiaceae bacterium]|jgi:type VI secretion system protein ImpG|nr:type VI secretion system baseplate subunit TssF [Polyangiaceae bacterium]